jgi:hypothetical protein
MFVFEWLYGKSVESVLAGFYKSINDLKEVANKHNNFMITKQDLITDLRGEVAEHKDEVSRALKIVAKLEEIFNA